MPRGCSICERPDVAAIDGAIRGGLPVREIARQYEIGRDALSRHAASHIAPSIAPGEASHSVLPEALQNVTPGGDNPPAEMSQNVTLSPEKKEASQPPEAASQLARDDTAPGDEREPIVQYIMARMGPELSAIYGDAIRSSVGNGCYDHEWRQGAPYPGIERYLAIVKKDWISHQGDASEVINRLFFLNAFGTPEQQAALRELDLVTSAVVVANQR